MKLGEDLLWLSEKDVHSLLTMPETLNAVEAAFKLHGQGQVQMPAKIYLDFEPFGGDLRAMPVYFKGAEPAAGVKIINSNPDNPARNLPSVTGIVVYNDPMTGLPLGVFAAGVLTSMRTGAGGGVAAKYLARPNSRTVGLIGCGRQAKTQMLALVENFSIEKVLVWGRTQKESQYFCQENQSSTKASLNSMTNVKESCQADIIVTTTPVREPLVKSEWIQPGVHINAIGADAPGKQELEWDLLKRSTVVVDDWAQASHAGEINNAVRNRQFTSDQVHGQLGEVVTSKKSRRQNEKEITIFDSTGLALQDVAIAQLLYKKALNKKIGKVLNFNG